MPIFSPFAFSQNSLDIDAYNFLVATNINAPQIVSAVNNLVLSLKRNNLWSKMRALYPMVGGTATTHKYNLKDPRDSDAAYRLLFGGTWTHDSNGAKPNGVAGTYADTFLNPSTALSQTNGHISYFSFTESAAANMVEIGQGFSGSTDVGECLVAVRWGSENFFGFWFHKQSVNGGGGTVNNTSRGFYLATRTTATTNFKNGVQTRSGGTGATTTGNYSFYLGAQNDGTTSNRNSSRGCSFSSIGDTLSATESATYSDIVNNFQKQLSRYNY